MNRLLCIFAQAGRPSGIAASDMECSQPDHAQMIAMQYSALMMLPMSASMTIQLRSASCAVLICCKDAWAD